MSDLKRYFELQDRINELTETIPFLEKIKALEKQVVTLEKQVVTARKSASKHKRANDQLRAKYDVKKVSRCDKARELLLARELGDTSLNLKEIAAKCFLGYSTIKKLAQGVRANLNEVK
tara:strand:- start:22276 stop:22632 length:357 start_codon:yes stop_codon:yes gene_type:complete